MKNLLLFSFSWLLYFNYTAFASVPIASNVVSAKLFQSNAEVSRSAEIKLTQGKNVLTLAGLPADIKDSSVKALFPNYDKVKIISLQVEQAALIEQRNQQIKEIEAEIEAMETKDASFVDQLKLIEVQQRFLSSVADFSQRKAEAELQTGTMNEKSWKSTLSFMTSEMKTGFEEKRRIEKERLMLGRKIQELEYQLSGIAGYKYFNNYQGLRKEIKKNQQSLQVQDYSAGRSYYANLQAASARESSAIDTEKQLIIECVSAEDITTKLLFSYRIPGPRWDMAYDLRVDLKSKKAQLEIYSEVYQQTGEDWNEIQLQLSTARPRSLGKVPYLASWNLQELIAPSASIAYSAKPNQGADYARKTYEPLAAEQVSADAYLQNASIRDGLFFEVRLPETQNIRSLNKPQKRLLRQVELQNAELIYHLKPAVSSKGFRMLKTSNDSEIDWLKGRANLFLNKEAVGNFALPYTPKSSHQHFELGAEDRILTSKKILKKNNENAGLFGGDKRQSYDILLVAENKLQEPTKVSLQDIVPVSQSGKIKVDIEYLDMKPAARGNSSADYARGVRNWKFSLAAGQKKSLRYRVNITYDKETQVTGLR